MANYLVNCELRTANCELVICPGIHDPQLTQNFISECLDAVNPVNILVVPVEGALTLSSLHIVQFLHDRLGNKLESPLIFISFSAGVVGAIAAAWQWQLWGGRVQAFIALDGWGVPLWGDFPIHRLSHDYFTHWSSLLLGSGQTNFYAEPPVDHLTMWRSPQTVQGWLAESSLANTIPKTPLTAAEFLKSLLRHYEVK